MEQKIKDDLKTAMLAKDEVGVATLRLLMSEMTYARVSKQVDSLSDEDVVSVVQKELKKRKESAVSFRAGNREELAQKEEAEAKVLEKYLPQQLSNEELTKIVEDSINKLGAKSPSDMGRVIGMVMGQVGQSADGSRVSTLVKEKLIG